MDVIATLSSAAFDILWEDLRLGAVPYPLERRSHGETFDERARIRAAVYAELEHKALARRGRAEPELEDALRLLATPQLRLEGIFLPDLKVDEPIKSVVVVRGAFAVRAVQRESTFVLDRVRDTALASSLVEVLPGNKPGAGRSVSMPADAVKKGHYQPDLSPQVQVQLRELATIMEKPVVRTGQFSISRADDSGKLRPVGGVSWFDTEAGRYANLDGRGNGGQPWVTVAPADNSRLVQQLNQLLSRN
jgi:hypothetical protein